MIWVWWMCMEKTQNYREIFYERYSKTQVGIDLNNIKQNLKSRQSYIKHVIKKHFHKDRNIKILDLGCGYGAFLYFLRDEGYLNLDGIDTSPEQVKLANELGLKNISCGDLLYKLKSLSDNSYDFIISFDLLEHFTKVEILEIIKEVYRVLKLEGKYIVHVPNGGAIFPGVVFYGDFTHEMCFTDRSLKQIFNVCGFNKMEFYEDIPIPHGIKSFVRYLLWKVIRSICGFIYMVESGSTEDIILSQNVLCVAGKSHDK